jgi:hypothetical protein
VMIHVFLATFVIGNVWEKLVRRSKKRQPRLKFFQELSISHGTKTNQMFGLPPFGGRSPVFPIE